MIKQRKTSHVPGEPGLWSLLIPDLAIFSMLFCTFLVYRRSETAAFMRSGAVLNRTLGLVDTLLLLASSLAVAIAVQRVREERPGGRTLFGIAIGFGLGFVALKLTEYGIRIRAGDTPATDDFLMFYFMLTGIHLVHVLIGLGVLLMLAFVAGRPDAARHAALVEGGACFWHVVDLLWMGLFALLYLAR